jgi:hypothetical protein
MYGVSCRNFRPAGSAGLRSIHILVFAILGVAERTKPFIQNEFLYDIEYGRFLIRRTFTLIGVLSSGISAVVANLLIVIFIGVMGRTSLLRGPPISEVITE